MYHTNADYKETVALFPQNYRMEIEITFDESTGLDTVTVPPEDIFEAGFSEELFLSTFCIGSTVEPCFWVRMHNPNGKYSENALATAEIRPLVTLYNLFGIKQDTVPIGVFHVTKITAQNSDLRLECMDRMTYLNRLFEPQGVETSLYALGRRIAQTVRAEFKSTPLNLITSTGKRSILQQTVNDSIFKGYSYAQVLSCIAEVCGSFAIFDNEGNLYLRWFKESDVTLTGDFARSPLELNGNTFSMDGNIVQVTGVNVVSEDTELARVGTDKYLLTLNENPIANAMPEAAANAVLYRLKNTKYIPCRYERIGGDPSIQLGDILTIIDNKEPYNEANADTYDRYSLFLTSRNWRFNGAFTENYNASGNPDKDLNTDRGMTRSKRLAQLAKRVTEVEKNITEGMTDYEAALLMFNDKLFNANGLYKTVKTKEDGSIILYFHDETELENSQVIQMFSASGFAWTTDGWNNGEPLWRYGFTDAGDAILNTINAYILSADIIKTGVLQSQNGASWINMDNGTFCFRSATPEGMDLDTGKAVYSYEEKLTLGGNGELGVYGELRSSQFPKYSIGIGPSVNDDPEVSIGTIALRATDSSYTNGDVFQIADSSFEDYSAVELRFPFLKSSAGAFYPGMRFYSDEVSIVDSNTECFYFGEGKTGYTETMLSNGSAKFGVLRDTVSVSGNYLNEIWFNYYEPYSHYTTKYHFGTGYQQGYAVLYAAGFNNVSDPALKENIQEISELNALDKIMALKFYSYDYKSPSDATQHNIHVAEKHGKRVVHEELTPPNLIHTEIGIMATEAPQEIQSADGKAIDLYAYINLMAKSVQELTEKVEMLEAKIKNLESES